MKPQDVVAGKSSLWIFGYGSLVWKPDFRFKRSKVGHVKGYKRRFWHGDNFHRGDDDLVSSGGRDAPPGFLGTARDVIVLSLPPPFLARKSGDADRGR